MPRWGVRAAVAVLVVLAGISAIHGARTALGVDGSIDLGMSLKAAQALLHDNPYERHSTGEASSGADLDSSENPFPMMPMQVPSALMLLWPLASLPWPVAKLAWLAANLVFTAGAFWLAARRFLPNQSRWCYAALAALLLVSFPWRVGIGNGQHLVAALFFFLLSVELADRGYGKWAGLALAASFLKYTVTLFLLPYLVWKRRWTPLVIAFAIHATMTLAVAILLRENPLLLVAQALQAGSATLATAGYIDLFAVVNSVGVPLVLASVLAVALAVCALWLAILGRVEEPTYVAFLCFISFLAVYHRRYDAVILLVPLLIAVKLLAREQLLPGVMLAAIACSWIIDRVVLELGAWLDRANEGWTAAYYVFVVALFYGSLIALLYRQISRGGEKAVDQPAVRPG